MVTLPFVELKNTIVFSKSPLATEIYNQLKFKRSGSIKYSIKTLVCFALKQPLKPTSISVSVNYVDNRNKLLIKRIYEIKK